MSSKLYPNLSEIIKTTLHNRTGTLAANLTENNNLLHSMLWLECHPGTVPLPEFIKLKAQGRAERRRNGKIYVKQADYEARKLLGQEVPLEKDFKIS